MADQRVERRVVSSRPQWANIQANGGRPRSPPPASPPPYTPPANQRPVLNPAQTCDLVCKVMYSSIGNRLVVLSSVHRSI